MTTPQEDEEGRVARVIRTSRAYPQRTLIIGAFVTALIFGAGTALVWNAAQEHRPPLSGSSDFLLLYTDGTSGIVDLEVEVGDPINLDRPELSVEVNIVARISPKTSTVVPTLIVPAGLGGSLTDCTGVSRRTALTFSRLTAGQQRAVLTTAATLPNRASLPPTPTSAPETPTPAPSADPEREYEVFELGFEAIQDHEFVYQAKSKSYPALEATVSCSLPAERVVRATWWGPRTFLVESLNVAARMEGGGTDSLARAAYGVQVSNAADWIAKRWTFRNLERVGREDDVRWKASGDYWWRFSEGPLGVVQPAGYAVFETQTAAESRQLLRYLAGFLAAVAIGALIIAGRRSVTYAAARRRAREEAS